MTRVTIEVETWHNGDEDPEEREWGFRGTTSGRVTDIYIVPDSEDYFYSYRGFETELESPEYALYAEYETGDTFGSDWEACIVGVGNTYEEMAALREEAEGHQGYGQLSNGFYVPWNGYFEHLHALGIRKIGHPRDRKTY